MTTERDVPTQRPTDAHDHRRSAHRRGRRRAPEHPQANTLSRITNARSTPTDTLRESSQAIPHRSTSYPKDPNDTPDPPTARDCRLAERNSAALSCRRRQTDEPQTAPRGLTPTRKQRIRAYPTRAIEPVGLHADR
jgi:hypothetical protein